MRKLGKCVSIVLGLVCLVSSHSFANPIAYDGFAYAPGPLVGDGPAFGFSAPWAADPGVMVNAPGLSSPLDLPSTGNAVEGDFNYYAPLSTTLAGQDFWASFLLYHSGPNDQTYMGFTNTLLPPTTPEVAFGVRLGQYGLFQGATFFPSAAPFSPVGSTDFLLAHFQPLGASWNVSLYVNPNASLGAPVVSVLVPMNPYNEVTNQNQLEFRSDEVRIGDTAYDAGFVPEPGSLAIAGVGLFFFMRRRHPLPQSQRSAR
jgi:hypothetical protein